MVQAVKARIIFLDLDGTLLNDDKRISDRDLAAIKKCQSRGLLCGIVTSRRRRKIFDLCNGFSPDFIAYYDGAIAEIREKNRFETLYCSKSCMIHVLIFVIISYKTKLARSVRESLWMLWMTVVLFCL